jgi:hypothetical protein
MEVRGRRVVLVCVGRTCGVAMLIAMLAASAGAHRGPPFPVLMNHALAHFPYVVSVWADPDIGDAQFYIVFEPADGTSPPLEVSWVSLWAEPLSGRLARADYPAARQTLRKRIQFAAHPYFDQRDRWKVGVHVTRADGQAEEFIVHVESTPPGLGPWDLALYLFPFLLFGGLWATALVRRHRLRH